MKRVLVTGATGFIGSQSLSFLLQSDYEIHAVSSSRPAQVNVRGINWHSVNLLKADEVRSLLYKVRPSHLLHFAWYALPAKFWTARENLEWASATLNLILAFSDQGGQRAVFAGSCAEYDWGSDFCSEQTTPCRPATLYGASKYSVQTLVHAWSGQVNISSAWGRIFFLYGPGEYSTRLVPSVIASLAEGKPAMCTHGNQVRDFMYVADVAAAFVALLDSDVKGVVNIASGMPIPVRDIVFSIADQLGRRDLVRLGAIPSNDADPAVLTADISRLRDEVGFKPSYNLERGIELTIESFKRAPLL